jgi:hypothetical protein
MENQSQIPVSKFTLSTKKTIMLREPKIRDTETIAQLAGGKAGDNMALMGVLMQKELFKLLLVAINDENVPAKSKDMLDDLFSIREWKECMKALTMVTGEDESGNELEVEMTNFGAK